MGTLTKLHELASAASETLNKICSPGEMEYRWQDFGATFDRLHAQMPNDHLWDAVASLYAVARKWRPSPVTNLDEALASAMCLREVGATAHAIHTLLAQGVGIHPDYPCRRYQHLRTRYPNRSKDFPSPLVDIGEATVAMLGKRGVPCRDWTPLQYRRICRWSDTSVVYWSSDNAQSAIGFHACRMVSYQRTAGVEEMGNRRVWTPSTGTQEMHLERIGIVGCLGNYLSQENMSVFLATELVQLATRHRCALRLSLA